MGMREREREREWNKRWREYRHRDGRGHKWGVAITLVRTLAVTRVKGRERERKAALRENFYLLVSFDLANCCPKT